MLHGELVVRVVTPGSLVGTMPTGTLRRYPRATENLVVPNPENK
jgi:hypothetical protein